MSMRRKAIAKKKAASRGRTFYGPKPKPARAATSKSKQSKTEKKHFVKNTVFVGMAFRGADMDDIYSAIKATCTGLGLNVKRVDENATSGLIVLEMVKLIQDAEFLIFDLTHERPNVYYELGFAHGCGNEPSDILLVAREGTDLHFDIAGLRIRFYKSTEDLRRIVHDTLTAMRKATR
jgi:hypothetical protein